jgi:hypothetical protein
MRLLDCHRYDHLCLRCCNFSSLLELFSPDLTEVAEEDDEEELHAIHN